MSHQTESDCVVMLIEAGKTIDEHDSPFSQGYSDNSHCV